MTEKLKPEVGDVWNYEGIKRLIVDKGVKTCDFFGVVDAILVLGDDYKSHWYNVGLFTKQATYLGKSKVNISDLFKTEKE
jgi:hypothetical protein